jgi:hypothetical protein
MRRAGIRSALLAALALLAAACASGDPGNGQGPPFPPTTEVDGTVMDGWQSGTLDRSGRGLDDARTTTVRPTTTPRDVAPPLTQQLGEDLTANRLRVPPEPPAVGTWRFISTGADGPVSFNACRPIHYRVRVGPGPAEGEALVAEAVARLSEATGLRFVSDGPVAEVPTSASFPAPNQAVSLADAFPPVVIGWATRDETDLWTSDGADTLGVGGPRTIVFGNDEKLSVSGFALLAPSDSLEPSFGPGLTVGNVLLHELGHLVGLDHVDDGGELMQTRLDRSAPDGFGPGDRRGLWELGAGRGCASTYLQLD